MRIFQVNSRPEPDVAVAGWWHDLAQRIAALGFDHWLISSQSLLPPQEHIGLPVEPGSEAVVAALRAAKEHGLTTILDEDPTRAQNGAQDRARLRLWAAAGINGLCVRSPAQAPDGGWRGIASDVRQHYPDFVFWAWTPGLTPTDLRELRGGCFDATILSLPWWDYRSEWLLQEYERLAAIAPVIAPVGEFGAENAGGSTFMGPEPARRMLWAGATVADGILVEEGLEQLAGNAVVLEANRWLNKRREPRGQLRQVSGSLSPVTAIFRGGESPLLLLINPSDDQPASVSPRRYLSRMPGQYGFGDALSDEAITLRPGACLRLELTWQDAAMPPLKLWEEARKALDPTLFTTRIAIEGIRPQVDGGRYPAKRVMGETVVVHADIFMDGHDRLAAELCWRAADQETWQCAPMRPLDNDRWEGRFIPERTGRYHYRVGAWLDDWASYREALRKKREANQDLALDVEEGRQRIASTRQRIADDFPETATSLGEVMRQLGRPQSEPVRARRGLGGRGARAPATHAIQPYTPEHVHLLLSDDLADHMREHAERRHETVSPELPLTVDRREALFSSWYELFPRSQNERPGEHGTFDDVIARLPDIKAMGFDVVYMPPIHPIGTQNRKGRNNSLTAGPDDPGSPYAIGSAEGGHDAVHPQLGTVDDFEGLVEAARSYGMEVAMDFAIQCSPDHPWLREHPEWFDWRADGSLRYAENPPKRYEDIVNPDFYTPEGEIQWPLWRALRDVVLFWAGLGVGIFRVDNPHTKPYPFWEWMIAEVQARYPGTIFLSEAFTRPKPMYQLAKLGFTQSYTYFTWRNTREELERYLTELNEPPVVDFFRPHFFVNTPDINPYFLQQTGRPGFLVRAALASTLSGLWGMYNGFEICENRALPGREEYEDSEKYELKTWDWDRPGNIIREISQLNAVRCANPALQTHRGVSFHQAGNEQVLFYTKMTPEQDNIVLVAVSMAPNQSLEATLELPVSQWPHGNGSAIFLQDLMTEGRFTVYQPRVRITLTPDQPFVLWRVMPSQ